MTTGLGSEAYSVCVWFVLLCTGEIFMLIAKNSLEHFYCMVQLKRPGQTVQPALVF